MTAPLWVAFIFAAGVGATARFTVDTVIADRVHGVFPWGTFVINVSGSLLLGILTGLALYHGLSLNPRLVFGTGSCGAFTTFSTFTFETIRLAEERAASEAVLNVGATVLCAAAAAGLGIAIAAL